MKTAFTFTFENPNNIYNRKYTFNMNFSSVSKYEKALDWAETGDDVVSFIEEMQKYGFHDVSFDPSKEFYGFSSDSVLPRNYIKVMELWKEFFTEHDIDCDDIVEVIEDKRIA